MSKYLTLKFAADLLAVGGSIIGSSLIASNIGYNGLGYFFFILASVATLYLLTISTASKSLYVVNGYFLFINIVGLVRY